MEVAWVYWEARDRRWRKGSQVEVVDMRACTAMGRVVDDTGVETNHDRLDILAGEEVERNDDVVLRIDEEAEEAVVEMYDSL